MEVRKLLSQTFESANSFEEVKRALAGPPWLLQVREEGDLFNLMISDASPAESRITDEAVGVIVSKSKQNIVGFAMNKTVEIVVDPFSESAIEKITQAVPEAFDRLAFHLYEEGVKLTVYHHEDEWKISTTRVIDAGKAFWTSPVSFKDQFLEACYYQAPAVAHQIQTSRREGELTPGLSYSFILISPHNKSLADVREPRLLHVSTVDVCTLQSVQCNLSISKPEQIDFQSWVEVTDRLQRSNYWMPGFIVTGKEKRYKLFTKEYKRVKELGGNTPDMFKHYLTLRQNPAEKAEFVKFYPKYRSLAATIERLLWRLSRSLHNLYVMYYVRKETRPLLDKTVFVTLMQIHEDYKQTGLKRTIERIYAHIDNLSPALQCILLRAAGLDHSVC